MVMAGIKNIAPKSVYINVNKKTSSITFSPLSDAIIPNVIITAKTNQIIIKTFDILLDVFMYSKNFFICYSPNFISFFAFSFASSSLSHSSYAF